MFAHKAWHLQRQRSILLLTKIKSDSGSGPGFSQVFEPAPDPKNAESCRTPLRARWRESAIQATMEAWVKHSLRVEALRRFDLRSLRLMRSTNTDSLWKRAKGCSPEVILSERVAHALKVGCRLFLDVTPRVSNFPYGAFQESPGRIVCVWTDILLHDCMPLCRFALQCKLSCAGWILSRVSLTNIYNFWHTPQSFVTDIFLQMLTHSRSVREPLQKNFSFTDDITEILFALWCLHFSCIGLYWRCHHRNNFYRDPYIFYVPLLTHSNRRLTAFVGNNESEKIKQA